jgi:hypothetical protein
VLVDAVLPHVSFLDAFLVQDVNHHYDPNSVLAKQLVYPSELVVGNDLPNHQFDLRLPDADVVVRAVERGCGVVFSIEFVVNKTLDKGAFS